ncbi:MerR family transcriptional regulator [Fodinicola feengrottensis]|nr:MerR family transcriptional regulator [Fodinicola feengrottensis]
MKSSDDLTIGELAGRFGLATHVLRHWESEGLITPRRLPNGRRRYDFPDVVQVAMILRGKEAGLSLEDIRETVQAPDGAARRKVLRRHRDDLQQRIDRLQSAKSMIDHALDCKAPDVWECGVFRARIMALVPPA